MKDEKDKTVTIHIQNLIGKLEINTDSMKHAVNLKKIIENSLIDAIKSATLDEDKDEQK